MVRLNAVVTARADSTTALQINDTKMHILEIGADQVIVFIHFYLHLLSLYSAKTVRTLERRKNKSDCFATIKLFIDEN